MIRRHRRVLPATLVALLVLALMVVVVVACVQVLLGQTSLLPFETLAATGQRLTWSTGLVLTAGAVLAVVGAVLLVAAWKPGAPAVLALVATPDLSDAGVTRSGLRRVVVNAATRVDGVQKATAVVTPRRIRATVHTGLHRTDGLAERVRTAISEQLDVVALARSPRVAVRVNRRRS